MNQPSLKMARHGTPEKLLLIKSQQPQLNLIDIDSKSRRNSIANKLDDVRSSRLTRHDADADQCDTMTRWLTDWLAVQTRNEKKSLIDHINRSNRTPSFLFKQRNQ